MKPLLCVSLISLFFFLPKSLLAIRPEWTTTYNGSGNGVDSGRCVAVDEFGNVYVAGRETLAGPKYATWVGKYDNDGLIQWTTTYKDGSVGYGIALDSSSNIYVTGNDATSSGNVILRKYSNSGLLKWATTYSTLSDYQHWGGVAVDASGNAYVTRSSSQGATGKDIWIGKYNTNGLLQWTTTYDGGDKLPDEGYAIALDSSANVYVTGYISKLPDWNAWMWLAKHDTNGLLSWTTTYSATPACVGYGIAVDTITGNIYVAGTINNTGVNDASFYDIWLGKFNNNGLLQWTTTYSGAGNRADKGYSVAVDTSGNVYVAGSACNTPTSVRAWIGKYDATGAIRWTATGSHYSIWYGVAVDSNRNVYVTGRSHNPDDVWTRKYSQAPSAPNPFEGNAISTTSIKWNWGTTSFEDQFRVMATTGGAFSQNLSTGTFSWMHSNLTINTSYSAFIEAFNTYGTSNTASLIRYTLTNPPTGLNADEVHVTSAAVSWSSNTNPSGTEYLVSRWVAGGSTDTFTLTTLTTTYTDLAALTTYYIQVQAKNGDGILTTPDGPLQLTTLRGPVLPPGNLSATALDGRKIKLEWERSPSEDVLAYNIYWDAGGGTIDYTALLDSVSPSVTQFTTDQLTLGVTYRFGVRAENPVGEEKNTDVVASATAQESFFGVRAAIKVPHSGKKIGGNRITVMAEIIQGSVFQVKHVEFQSRTSTTSAWQAIPAVTAQQPNPDANFPFFIHWDVTSLSTGTYELKAVATDMQGVADNSPPTIVITVDHADPDVEEKMESGSHQRREKIFSTVDATIRLGDGQTNTLTQVVLPAGAINIPITVVKVIVNPANSPSPPADLTASGQVREITLESGQTALNTPATLTFQYEDFDNNCYVDGTSVKADKLAIYVYDGSSGRWRKEFSSSVDTANKTVTAQTSHFSLFGLFAPAAVDLSNILVYPVPWVPNDGVADNGKPFNSADPDSGIIFDNITQSVKIQIFTITGELVWEKVTDTSSGKIQWNGKNKSGRDVASGGYFAVITDTVKGNKVVRKLAIIR